MAWSKHVQYTQTESIRLRHFTIRLDSHVTSQLDSHGVASRKLTSGMTNQQQEEQFASIRSNRLDNIFNHPVKPTGSQDPWNNDTWTFLVLKTWPQTSVDLIESTRIDNIFNPPSKSRSTIFSKSRTNWLRWNRVHESISGLSNRKYQRRIDSTSWVYWTTLAWRGEKIHLPSLLFRSLG